MNLKILALALIAIALFGCARNETVNYMNGGVSGQQPGNGQGQKIPQLLEFDRPFDVSQGQIYSDMAGIVTVSVVSFEDSRCPQGTQCIWAGELGVTLNVAVKDNRGETWKEKIYLGESRAKSAQFTGHEFGLISITEKSATILVKTAEQPSGNEAQPGSQEWLSTKPAQCGENGWDKWLDEYPQNIKKYKDEKSVIIEYLKSKGIEAKDFATHQFADIVCSSCSCPRGDEIAVLVDLKDSAKLEALGWKKIRGIKCTIDTKPCPGRSDVGRVQPFCEFPECPAEPVACTMDVKTCPDGSFVGRIAPNCEFAPCPGDSILCPADVKTCPNGMLLSRAGPKCEFPLCPGEIMGCTKELMICPDGTSVGRVLPNCEFTACPKPDYANMDISIVKNDLPGFVITPVTVETAIRPDGSYDITTTKVNRSDEVESTEISTVSGKMERAELEEIANEALESGFFGIPEKDMEMCVTDIPTKNIEIKIGKASKIVYNLGVECDRGKLAAAYKILGLIEQKTKQTGQ